jgi:hypothetical protein
MAPGVVCALIGNDWQSGVARSLLGNLPSMPRSRRAPVRRSPLPTHIAFEGRRRGVVSSLVLRSTLPASDGPALLARVHEALFELRVQVIRQRVARGAVLCLDVVEFDGAPLAESRQRQIERALRAFLGPRLGPGLVKTGRAMKPARVPTRAAAARLAVSPLAE